MTKDGKTAYVSVRNDNAVRIVDVSGDEPVLGPLVAIGTQPDTLQLSNDGSTLVVGLRGTPQLAFMDTETLAVRPVTVAGHGISGHEWLSANGKFTFVAMEGAGLARDGRHRDGRGAPRHAVPDGPAAPARRVLRATGAAVAQRAARGRGR